MLDALTAAAQTLCDQLAPLHFSPPVTHTYNPLTYAWQPHRLYLEKYATTTKKTLFLGMNPGPFGMAQTGIPFGEIASVRDWMGIHTPVEQPDSVHPKRPILGFDCPRSEVSGRRLWGLFSAMYPNASDFFADHFVVNFCPLVWMSETGSNITPDKLPKAEIAPVDEACQRHLATLIQILQPTNLIGVGAFAEKQLKQTAKNHLPDATHIGRILHPSPASPAANRGWAEAATRQMKELGIW